MNKRILVAAAACGIGLAGGALRAETIYTAEQGAPGAVTLDQNPVIDYIASQPGTGDGYTYSKYVLITSDSSGSLEIYSALPNGTTYVPTVGDAITASGSYGLFNNIPELQTLTAISGVSSGNAVPSPVSVTIPELVAGATSTNYNISEYLLTLPNVTLSGAASFATHANTTLTATDASGNTLTIYQWASSYMAAGALGGTAVPAGPVNITGIVDAFSGSPEFIPFSITPVPEPAALSLLALGGLALLTRRRK